MPLVYVGSSAAEYPASEARIRARKIRPEFTEGPLVRVAGGRNQVEAELIQNLLLEEGVPSVLRRTAGFDVPDFLAAGPRDVLVPEAGVATPETCCSSPTWPRRRAARRRESAWYWRRLRAAARSPRSPPGS